MKKLFVLAIALLLCLSACGGSDDDTAGDDWRTSGIVVGNGTITHDGESVDVLVTISDTSAAFYRDTAEQVLFDSVLFPESIPDAKQAFESISFDDIDGDGESDVVARFEHEIGDTTELVWIWDPAERYMFSKELSTGLTGGDDTEPYFTANGLLTNGEVGKGRVKLKDGASFYANLGEDYATDDCYWEVSVEYDQTHDGIREMQFDAKCYIPASSVPVFSKDFITVTDSELYDAYSGMWLTAATAYGSSDRGDNYYVHTVERDGVSSTIEFAYSTDWQYNVGDWAQVLTKSYVVYMPEDYDGLIFAAEAQPDNYKDSAKRMQLDSISPEAAIMDIPTLDPHSNLYFAICG